MRVIAGQWKGTRLASPVGQDVRPTTDKVKEAMFGSLQFNLPGARVLDMFGGSGALGIEAASRGASQVWIVEWDAGARRTIQENLRRVGSPGDIHLVRGSYERALERLAGDGQAPFDIVLLDPPYAKGLYVDALRSLVESGLAREGTIAVLESDGPTGAEDLAADGLPLRFEVNRTRRHGTVILTFGRFTAA